MTDIAQERRGALYDLLPAHLRQRDIERGAPLGALLDILADEGGRMEDDVLRLLDDWFIETCDEWVVPYIGALLGVRGLQETAGAGFSRRALVANTLGYRRRKGVAGVLEQLTQDATGWRAVAREMFMVLSGTQHLNHLRPSAHHTPDLRNSAAFDVAQGPFGTAAHMVDVRSVALGRGRSGGRFNIPNIALFVWRLQAYRLRRAAPMAAGPGDSWRLSPAGVDVPMFNPPLSDPGTDARTGPRGVPAPLRRRALHDELEARRTALAAGRAPAHLWFDTLAGAPDSAFALELDGVPVPPARLSVCDLSGWSAPADSRDYQITQADGTQATVTLPIDAAIDPELGRLMLAPARTGAVPRITWSTGFSGDLGAGPFGRRAHLDPLLDDRPVTWAVGVSADPQSPATDIFPTLAAALAVWSAQPPGTVGLIAVMDSARHVGGLTGVDRVQVPEGSRLLILGADWPALQDPGAPPGVRVRLPGRIDPDGVLPIVTGDIEVEGTAPSDSETPGELILDGLFIDGSITVGDGHLGRLSLSHMTVMPPAGGLVVEAGNPALVVTLHRTICGPVAPAVPLAALRVTDSILQAAGDAIAAPATLLEICDSTLFGGADCLTLEASGTIFLDPVRVARRQAGCARYCYLPEGSVAPRQFRCQPQLALANAPAADHPTIRARMRPVFTANEFGQPGFGQLARRTPEDIARGGEDRDEMGAFRLLKQPQRLANLNAILPDYLPFGLSIGTFFET